MVTQEFSMRRWPRWRGETTISRRADGEKLRAAAGVGARDDVGMEWLETHPEARARAVREAIEEELKIHAARRAR